MAIHEWIGMAGAVVAGVAYLPQIIHLIKEQCSAGISQRAYAMWLASSVLVTISAWWSGQLVFIVLGITQLSATATIYYFSIKYQGMVCPTHQKLAGRPS